MKESDWIDVAKTGTFTANNGEIVTLNIDDLDAIAQNYNPAVREAPLVFGHPTTNSPAFGWALQFRRIGNTLQAKFKQVTDTVKDVIRKGHYKKISLALMPDRKTVRHIGLLGAAQPAIPGMRDVEFSSGESFYFEDTSSYSNQEIMDAYHGTRRSEFSHPCSDYVDLTKHV